MTVVNNPGGSRVSHLVLFLSIQRGARAGTLGPGGLLGAIRSWCYIGWTVWSSSFSWVFDPGGKESAWQSVHLHSC